jgi:hypothetical protein
MSEEGVAVSSCVVPGNPRIKELMMNLALWIVAGLLAVVFLVASAKLFVPKEKMAGMSASSRWVEDFSPGAFKAIGALELLVAVGLSCPPRSI